MTDTPHPFQQSPYTQASPPQPEPEPAPWPDGFWHRVDYIIRNSEDVVRLLQRGENLGSLARTFAIVSLLMAALYGSVMGATNLLQGSDMALQHKSALILITALKVPALFLLTLAIVFPPVYVSNAFAGARFTFQRMLALLTASVALTSTILASMASVSFFFALTSISYHFIKLLHVAVFAYAGIIGLSFLVRGVRLVSRASGRKTPKLIFALWLVLYVFVGTQLAWVMRPFVGSPNEPFQVFRERSGNFYESVFFSLERLLVEDPNDPVPATRRAG